MLGDEVVETVEKGRRGGFRRFRGLRRRGVLGDSGCLDGLRDFGKAGAVDERFAPTGRDPTFAFEAAPNGQHRQLHQVGGGSLNDGVDRGAFREVERFATASAPNAGERAAPSEERLNEPAPGAVVENAVEKGQNARVSREKRVDVSGGFRSAYVDRFREPERRLPVNEPEVDRFRFAAHIRRYVGLRDAEETAGDERVNVFAVRERPPKLRVAGKVRQNAEFDLAVVAT